MLFMENKGELTMHEKEAKALLSSENGMNIYRGCTHGCIYCDSRSRCYQMDFPFEDVEVKSNAPKLLEKALRSKRKKCMIGTGAMTDPYMHCEEILQNMGLKNQIYASLCQKLFVNSRQDCSSWS